MVSTACRTLLIATLCLVQACSAKFSNQKIEALTPPKSTTPKKGATSVGDPDKDPIYQGTVDEKMVVEFLKTNCANCHAKDDGVSAPYTSSWEFSAKSLSQKELEVSTSLAAIYQSLANKIAKEPTSIPSPMPHLVTSTPEMRSQIRAVLGWFRKNLPFAITDAASKYGVEKSDLPKIQFQFQCTKPTTLRLFINRIANAAFDRGALPAELAEFDVADLEKPVTPAQRTAIVARLRTSPWKEEFLKQGLKKIAMVIGGGTAIQASTDLAPDVVADLKQEFYQLLLTHYDDWPYRDFFMSDTVMVSAKTAPLYGCAPAAPSGAPTPASAAPSAAASSWSECTMQAPRAGFFSTLGFLNSRRTSFLRENNNYGRVGLVYFTLRGESFQNATNGPSGDTEVPALPECLEQIDTRAFTGAPRGSAAIPHFGSVCQNCHIGRNLAAGSVLFRPFSSHGLIYKSDTLGAAATPDKSDVEDATKADKWSFTESLAKDAAKKPVTKEFLSLLLNNPVKACISTGKKQEPFVAVSNLKEFSEKVIGDENSLASGFARHTERALVNLAIASLETIMTVSKVHSDGKKTLPDLLEAYFGTETFACSEEVAK